MTTSPEQTEHVCSVRCYEHPDEHNAAVEAEHKAEIAHAVEQGKRFMVDLAYADVTNQGQPAATVGIVYVEDVSPAHGEWVILTGVHADGQPRTNLYLHPSQLRAPLRVTRIAPDPKPARPQADPRLEPNPAGSTEAFQEYARSIPRGEAPPLDYDEEGKLDIGAYANDRRLTHHSDTQAVFDDDGQVYTLERNRGAYTIRNLAGRRLWSGPYVDQPLRMQLGPVQPVPDASRLEDPLGEAIRQKQDGREVRLAGPLDPVADQIATNAALANLIRKGEELTAQVTDGLMDATQVTLGGVQWDDPLPTQASTVAADDASTVDSQE